MNQHAADSPALPQRDIRGAGQDRIRTAFEDAPFGMCMTMPDGPFLRAYAAVCAMPGYSEQELHQEMSRP
jgi:PAS domain-containing protein